MSFVGKVTFNQVIDKISELGIAYFDLFARSGVRNSKVGSFGKN